MNGPEKYETMKTAQTLFQRSKSAQKKGQITVDGKNKPINLLRESPIYGNDYKLSNS